MGGFTISQNLAAPDLLAPLEEERVDGQTCEERMSGRDVERGGPAWEMLRKDLWRSFSGDDEKLSQFQNPGMTMDLFSLTTAVEEKLVVYDFLPMFQPPAGKW